MPFTWEGKSSWAGVASTKPGRVFVYWVDFTSNGGKGAKECFALPHPSFLRYMREEKFGINS